MTKYFFDLNYTLANEDTTYEFEVAKSLGVRKILSVGGSGSRCLPFLALNIESLIISDISLSQHLLIKLKLLSIKLLSHDDCLLFWTTNDREKRALLFTSLSTESELTQFFTHFNSLNSDIPMLYWGKWEKTFRTFSKIVKFLFSEKIRKGVFESETPYEFYKKHIDNLRWKFILSIVGNKAIFNSLLYKGDFVKKNISQSYFDFYHSAFDRLFKLEIKKSHFLQLCFFGEVIYYEGLPLEFQKDIFSKIKESNVDVTYSSEPIFYNKADVDFISLSDVPSYLSGELEKDYLNHLANKHPLYIVERYYLRHPEVIKDYYEDISDEFKDLACHELVQMYDIKLWKLR